MKKYFGILLAVMMMAVMSIGFTSCGDDDDNGSVNLSDEEIAATLQGTWDIVQYYPEDGESPNDGDKDVWIFSGNKVSTYSLYNHAFTIQNGVIHSNAFDGGIVLTKLTDTKLEGYWTEYSGEKYYGVKRK